MKTTFLTLFILLFFIPLHSKAAITYERSPNDFYSGNGTTITIDSDDYLTDFQDCVQVILSSSPSGNIGTDNIDNPMAPIVINVPDNNDYTIVLLYATDKLLNCSDYDFLNLTQTNLEEDQFQDGAGSFHNSIIFSTLPVINASSLTSSSTDDIMVTSQTGFFALVLFLMSLTISLWTWKLFMR